MKSRFLYPLLLVALVVIIGAANYTPGTFLIGWDNVMPEFNLGLNLKRTLFAVWQEYRGLGHYDGMAHAANFMHTVYIWLLSLVLPISAVRYVFMLITYFLGGISFFFLAKKVVKNESAALVGALFYLLNFAVIQLYFAPLEVFAVHFVALPAVAFVTTNFLTNNSRKNVLMLFGVSFLVSPQGFVPTIFIASIISLLILIAVFAVKKQTFLRNGFVGLVIFLAANMFWFLPYMYGLPTTSKALQHTRINEFSSQELYERNRARGDIISVLFMKSFMVDTPELDVQKQENVPFMQTWIDYTSNPLYIIGYLGILGVLGYGIHKTRKEKNYDTLPYLGMFGVSFFLLANNTIPFSSIHGLLRFSMPTLAEAFRIPFTKFGTLYAFSFAMLLGFGFSGITKHARFRKVSILIPVFIILLAFPVFRGQFFSPLLRVQVPQDYFKLMDYLEKQPDDKRIALLPAQTFWNWQYRSFGQRGSDFLWYGIKQPILLRAFDPWSEKNESFYQELSSAINTEDEFLFRAVLKKYNVSYLLLDQYIINNSATKPINYDRLHRFLEKVTGLEKEKIFGQLELFSIDSQRAISVTPKTSLVKTAVKPFARNDSVFLQTGNYREGQNADVYFPFANLYTDKLQSDLPFSYKESTGDFTLSMKSKGTISGLNLLSIPSYFEHQRLIPVRITVQNQTLLIETVYPQVVIDNTIYKIDGEQFTIPIQKVSQDSTIEIENVKKTSKNGELTFIENSVVNTIIVKGAEEQHVYFDTQNIYSVPFRVMLDSKTIQDVSFVFPKIEISEESNLLEDGTFELKQTADLGKQFFCFPKKNEYSMKRSILKLQATCGTVEASRYFENLLHKQSYLFIINSRNQIGLPTTFSIDNPFEKRAEFESKLSEKGQSVFILPPSQEYYSGYGIHFIEKSLSPKTSKTDITRLSIYYLPFETLQQVVLRRTKTGFTNQIMESVSYSHPQPDRYIAISNKPEILVLFQGFSNDWKAYMTNGSFLHKTFPFFGQKIKDHFLVNNWANGWSLSYDEYKECFDKNCRIHIIFLPQYLEYIGFGFLLTAFCAIILKRNW